MKFKYVIAYVALAFCTLCNAQSITLTISGIESAEGTLNVAVFENQQQFDDEKPAKNFSFDKTGMSNGTKTVQLKIAPGTYGITVLDDEDESGDMTYRFGIYPLEGVGFSYYMLSGMTKPEFEDFDFILSKEHKQMTIKMKYF